MVGKGREQIKDVLEIRILTAGKNFREYLVQPLNFAMEKTE